MATAARTRRRTRAKVATRRTRRKPKRRKKIPKLQPLPGNSPLIQDPTQGSGPESKPGAHLGPAQIAQLLVARGFGWDADAKKDDQAEQAVRRMAQAIAIVMCESSGNWAATSANPSGGTNRGGWQIDDKSHPSYGVSCLHDPECSTDAAKDISHNGANFSPWACSSADPQPYLEIARHAYETGTRGGPLDGALNAIADIDPLEKLTVVVEAIARFFVGLGELLLTPEGWVRLGKLVLGAAVVLWGLSKLAGQLGGGARVAERTARSGLKSAASAAASAVPAGRIGKAVGAVT